MFMDYKFEQRILDAGNIIKVLGQSTSEQLEEFGVESDSSSSFVSFRRVGSGLSIPSARLFSNTSIYTGGFSFGTHIGGNSSLSVVIKTNKVLVEASSVTLSDLIEVQSTLPTEEELFQLSTIYTEPEVQRIVEYIYLRSFGYAVFFSWNDMRNYPRFADSVLNCGVKYGHL